MEWVFLGLQAVVVIALLVIASRLKQMQYHSDRLFLALENYNHFLSRDLDNVKREVCDITDELKDIRRAASTNEEGLNEITKELRNIEQEAIANGRTLHEILGAIER